MEHWYKKGEALLEEIASTRVSPDELALWPLGQVGFCFRAAERTVLIDPVLNDMTRADGHSARLFEPPFPPEALRADLVLCTHGHADHMAVPTLKGLLRANPALRVVLPEGCVGPALAAGLPETALVPLRDGKEAEVEGIAVRAFSAAHPTHVDDPADPAMALGYLLELDGFRAAHLGDTHLTERLLTTLRSLRPIDLLFAPINGDDVFRALRNCIGNMEAEAAARLAIDLDAGLTIPTHYDMIEGNTVDPLRFVRDLRALSPRSRFALPAPGERIVCRR